MNKKEAAQYLAVSERTLTNYVASGRLNVSYIKGKTRDIADFEMAELERLKSEIQPVSQANSAQKQDEKRSLEDQITPVISSNLALETRKPRNQETDKNGPVFLVLPAAQVEDILTKIGQKTRVSVAEKPVLTLPEAAQFTGISERILREAAKKGELNAVTIGRSKRVLKEDLEQWLRRLFKNQ